MSSPDRNPRLWVYAIGAVAPSLVFMTSLPIADMFLDSPNSFRWGGVDAAETAFVIPYLVMFISGPAAVPMAFARSVRQIGWVSMVFCIVSAVAAALVINTDDAQAGMAVFLVAMFGVPIACVGLLANYLFRRATGRPVPVPR